MVTIMEKVTFGIVGCGKVGEKHANILFNNPEAELIGVSDVNKERARSLADKFNCKAFSNYDEMLKQGNIDVITICTPSGLHAKHTMEAANNFKHVLCEKPMALSIKDCDRMMESCRRSGVNLFVVKQNRYNPPVMKLKELLDKKKLGKIYLVDAKVLWNRNVEYYTSEPWRGTKGLDGGALFTLASHFIDLMYWLFGPVKSVYAKMENFNHEIETEDTGTMIMKFKKGILGTMNYTTNIYNKNLEGSISVFGTKGHIKIGGTYLNKMELFDVEGQIVPEIPEAHNPSNHEMVVNNVIDVLKKRRRADVIGEDAKESVRIIEAANKSAVSGKEIVLNGQ